MYRDPKRVFWEHRAAAIARLNAAVPQLGDVVAKAQRGQLFGKLEARA